MPRPSLPGSIGHSSQSSESLPPTELAAVRREMMHQLITNDPHVPMRGMEPSFPYERPHPASGMPMNFQRQGHAPMHGSHPDNYAMGRMQHMQSMNMEPMNHRGPMYPSSSQFGSGMTSQQHFHMSPGQHNASRMASIAQQNKEDELLARLLMARRQRMQHQAVDNALANDAQSLADDLLLLRQAREADAMLLGPPDSPYAMRSPSMKHMGSVGMPPGINSSAMSHRGSHPAYAQRPSPIAEASVLRPTSIMSNTPGMLSREIDEYLRKQEMSGMATRMHSPERIDRLPPRFTDMRSHELAQHQMELMMNAGRHNFDQLKIPNIDPPAKGSESLKRKRAHKKKPADMPRRPLSAYNLFFSEERERILKEIDSEASADAPSAATAASATGVLVPAATSASDAAEKPVLPAALLRPLVSTEKKRRPHRKTHGKISFKLLAQMVGQRWKSLPEVRRKYYQDLAEEDLKRHKAAMEDYYKKQSKEGKGEMSGDSVNIAEDDEGDDQDEESPTLNDSDVEKVDTLATSNDH